MKSLLLLRHAKSSWAEPGVADRDRPLNERGKRDAPRVGALLAERDLRPDLILCSTAKRARKTAKRLLEASGFDTELALVDRLYLAPPGIYLAELRQLPETVRRVLVVGHNPGLEDLLAAFTGHPRHLPTAALAQLDLPIESWPELVSALRSELVLFWTPGHED